MAASEGLEPPTLALGKPCSIRLSYEATFEINPLGWKSQGPTSGAEIAWRGR